MGIFAASLSPMRDEFRLCRMHVQEEAQVARRRLEVHGASRAAPSTSWANRSYVKIASASTALAIHWYANCALYGPALLRFLRLGEVGFDGAKRREESVNQSHIMWAMKRTRDNALPNAIGHRA
jgi:hypothetical protein